MENSISKEQGISEHCDLNKKVLEYVLLGNLDYNYLIEEFVIDTNHFDKIEEKQSSISEKEKKQKEKVKGTKEANKNKKQQGKKKKKEDEELDVSRASSNLSIFTIKSNTGSNNKKIADQKIKAAIQAGKSKNFNVNVLIEKRRNQVEIIKNVHPLPSELITAPVEELIDANIKQEELEDESSKKNDVNLPNQSQGKKNKKEKVNSKKKSAEEKIEAKPVKEEKANQQNKRVEDFLKSVKEKKTTKEVKEEKKISIKSEFISTHKYLFTVDPTQRLKLRNLYKLDYEPINAFFKLVSSELNFEKINSGNDNDTFRNNMKETALLIDNLCELSFINATDEEIKIIIEKSLDLILSAVVLYESRYQNNANQFKSDQIKPSLENLVMNVLYTIYKYLLEGLKLSLKNIKQIDGISDILANLFKIFLGNTKNKKINLKNEEEISFILFSNSICLIILSQIRGEKEISQDGLENLNSNIQSLFSQMKIDKGESIQEDYDIFLEDYDNLKFFTRFSYLFDRVRPNLSGLSIKVSKSIESQLTQIQSIIVKNNEDLFSKLINQIVLNYIHIFDTFYEINENLYEEIFSLIKYLCETKVFTHQNILQLFTSKDKGFDKRLVLENISFISDDVTGKYIGLLIKYIKYFEILLNDNKSSSDSNMNNRQNDLFLFYFHQVLFNILNLRPGYIREKYYKIIEKLIEPYLQSDNFAELIFEFMTEFIKNNLLKDYENNFLKNIKLTKDLTKFYSGYIQVKKNILKVFNKHKNNDLEYDLFSLFYLNFLNLKKKEDVELLHLLIANSDNFIENILFVDRRLCSYIMRNYINEEINSLDGIIDVIFKDLRELQNVSFENLFGYIITFMKNIFYTSNTDFETIPKIKLVIDLIEKLISIDMLSVEKLEILLNNLVSISISKNDINFNSDFLNTLKSMIIFILNKIIFNYQKKNLDEDVDYKVRYEYFLNLCDKILSNENLFNGSKIFLFKELSLINDNLKTIRQNEYVKNLDDIFLFTIENLKLQQLLIHNPDYFKVDTVEIERIEEEAETGDIKVIKDSDSDKVNFDIVLHGFINYFNIINSILSKNLTASNIDIILFNVTTLQESINIVLSSEMIFKNLLKNKILLEEFVKKYVALKELSYEINKDSQKMLKKIADSNDSNQLTHHKNEISKYLNIIELNSQISVSCGNFIKTRCRNQIVHLFKEQDVYKMFLTKDKEFLQLLNEKLDFEYKKTILNEDNLKNLIKKAQNEDEDLLEEVVYSIFSEKIIRYLEYPEEIIEFLTAMNEAMKYDLKVDSKKYFVSILSYFYTWKSIISKIENGFKLYTTEKNLVETIDSYKTLLKFIVNYLERNTKIYEMFLLLTVSLIHLIDEEKSLEDKSYSYHLDKFEDSLLTDSLDMNSFQFLLSVLYKFVKIFPSLVKYYYEETKTKLKNTFKSLNTNIIVPKMLSDLRERIESNSVLLAKYQIKIRDTKSMNYLEFDFNANDEIKFVIEIRIPPIFPLK